MTMPVSPPQSQEPVYIAKWAATGIQLVGYSLTGMNTILWNVFAFFAGIILWFAVGVMRKNKAIMVVHLGAFISIFVGYLNS